SFFVMGDHRNNSRDSRYWGFVPRPLMKCRGLMIWFSYAEDRDGWTRTGVEKVRSLFDKATHILTRTRWPPCFTLLRSRSRRTGGLGAGPPARPARPAAGASDTSTGRRRGRGNPSAGGRRGFPPARGPRARQATRSAGGFP